MHGTPRVIDHPWGHIRIAGARPIDEVRRPPERSGSPETRELAGDEACSRGPPGATAATAAAAAAIRALQFRDVIIPAAAAVEFASCHARCAHLAVLASVLLLRAQLAAWIVS
jgi:hypothetical protein